MVKPLDIKGEIFGQLTVLEKTGNSISGHSSVWKCVCNCGNVKEVLGSNLKAGKTKSCGCLLKTNTRIGLSSIKHGMHNTSSYRAWANMIYRCTNSNYKYFHHYGGRGIEVIAHWRNSFENFLKDMGECPNGMSLDRINNDGNYQPDNCRWATNKDQANNKRNNVKVTYQNETKTIAQWSRVTGVGTNVIRRRLLAGWNIADALTVPSQRAKERLIYREGRGDGSGGMDEH